ncbi:MAG: threonine synthase [Fibrobacter sp.]|nr:threonine synthase [Fibrobacter sp.]
MLYISTRGNYQPVTSSQAINLGMVPEGGLFVPQGIPSINYADTIQCSYQELAKQVFTPYLSDFTEEEIKWSVDTAYNAANFDSDSIIKTIDLYQNMSVMELWHGPTAAFKDVALQIMPCFMQVAKKKSGNKAHTIILVATSGDTGKAALEGFKDSEGISIIVFYPHEGVSEIQRLQMATTDGSNTHVVAVKGNFDDCQTGVKQIFSDIEIRKKLANNGFEFSSANSINWGRLCPQIVYYFKSYADLVENGKIKIGQKINFCIPTGNFGNILAGFYAKQMGLPINKLICASNKNRVLTDFFTSGTYNNNREFFRTISPSMDILISSNLERFLFEVTNHNSDKVSSWYDSLNQKSRFTVDAPTMETISSTIVSGWVDEHQILSTIKQTYEETGYVMDTHTSVGVALCKRLGINDCHTVVASTASPYKFSCDVLEGIDGSKATDEFESITRISELSKTSVHRALDHLKTRPVNHKNIIEISEMKAATQSIIDSIQTSSKG